MVQTPLTNSEEKRSLIFNFLPQLISLDFRGKDGEEVEYSSGEEEESEGEGSTESYEVNTPENYEEGDDDDEEEEEVGEDELGEDELDDVLLLYP